MRPDCVFINTRKTAQSFPTPVFWLTIDPAMTRYWSRTGGATGVPSACEAGTLNSTVCVFALMQCPAVNRLPPSISQPVQPIGIIRPARGLVEVTLSSVAPHIASVLAPSRGATPSLCNPRTSSGMKRLMSGPRKLRKGSGVSTSAPLTAEAGRPMITSLTLAETGSVAPCPGVKVTRSSDPLNLALNLTQASIPACENVWDSPDVSVIVSTPFGPRRTSENCNWSHAAPGTEIILSPTLSSANNGDMASGAASADTTARKAGAGCPQADVVTLTSTTTPSKKAILFR